MRPIKEGKALGFSLVAAWKDSPEDPEWAAMAQEMAAAALRTLGARRGA